MTDDTALEKLPAREVIPRFFEPSLDLFHKRFVFLGDIGFSEPYQEPSAHVGGI